LAFIFTIKLENNWNKILPSTYLKSIMKGKELVQFFELNPKMKTSKMFLSLFLSNDIFREAN